MPPARHWMTTSGEPVKDARTTARMTQAKASPMAPAEMATVPIGESAKPFDRTIHTSIGNAVTESAAPRKSICWPNVASPANQPGIFCVARANGIAKQNGTSTPAAATARVKRLRWRTWAKSKSKPMQNKYPPTPSSAKNFSASRVEVGNSHSCSAGQRAPSKDGPSSTPAIIIPTTEGWPKRSAIHPATRQASRTMMA